MKIKELEKYLLETSKKTLEKVIEFSLIENPDDYRKEIKKKIENYVRHFLYFFYFNPLKLKILGKPDEKAENIQLEINNVEASEKHAFYIKEKIKFVIIEEFGKMVCFKETQKIQEKARQFTRYANFISETLDFIKNDEKTLKKGV